MATKTSGTAKTSNSAKKSGAAKAGTVRKPAAKKPGGKKAAGGKKPLLKVDKLVLKGLIRMSPKDRAATVAANIGATTPLSDFLKAQGWRE